MSKKWNMRGDKRDIDKFVNNFITMENQKLLTADKAEKKVWTALYEWEERQSKRTPVLKLDKQRQR